MTVIGVRSPASLFAAEAAAVAVSAIVNVFDLLLRRSDQVVGLAAAVSLRCSTRITSLYYLLFCDDWIGVGAPRSQSQTSSLLSSAQVRGMMMFMSYLRHYVDDVRRHLRGSRRFERHPDLSSKNTCNSFPVSFSTRVWQQFTSQTLAAVVGNERGPFYCNCSFL